MTRSGPRGSLTVRLTAVATLATLVVLTLVLAGVLTLFSHQLDASVDDGLRARLADLSLAVQQEGPGALVIESLAQLADGDRIVAASAALPAGARLAPSTGGCRPGGVERFSNRRLPRPGAAEPLRLRVLARCLPDGERVLAVGVDVVPQQEARERLIVLLAVTGPLLLLLVAAVVGRAVHAALRPVDLLTREAATISAGSDTRRRLPTVAGDDEIARLATTLDAMLARLAVAFDREQSFVDDASHELRTPIAVLRGELELAVSDLADTAAVEQSLHAALSEAQRLSRLVNDLLVLARTGGDAVRPGPDADSDTDVTALLTGTADRLAGVTGLRLTVQSPSGVNLALDREQAERVLVNLIVNAAAAGAHAVTLSARVAADQVLVDVADDGPGFDPAFLAVAFERFSRADAARGTGGGTGLGLALVQAVVRSAGGTVTAGNGGPLGGALLRLSLPRGSSHDALIDGAAQ